VLAACTEISPILFTETSVETGNKAAVSIDEAVNVFVNACVSLELLTKTIRESGSSTVLDLGTGTGYVAACLAHIVGDSGSVVTVDINESTATKASITIRDSFPHLEKRIKFLHGNAKSHNFLNAYPDNFFAAINVGAAVKEFAPEWLRVLSEGGGMVLPLIGTTGEQVLTYVFKEKSLNKKEMRHFTAYSVRSVNYEEMK